MQDCQCWSWHSLEKTILLGTLAVDSLTTQGVLLRPAPVVSPGKLLEMQISGLTLAPLRHGLHLSKIPLEGATAKQTNKQKANQPTLECICDRIGEKEGHSWMI